MKTIFCALFSVVFFFGASAQSDLGLLSAYVDKYAPTEEAPQCLLKFETYLEQQQVLKQVASNLDEQLIPTLDALFDLKDPSSYINNAEYQSLLENYESAPKCADFSITDIVEYGPEVMRTDYKLTEGQVLFVDHYAAIDDTAPFDNHSAIKDAFDIIEGVKGLAIVTVTFDNRYSVGLLGGGKNTIVANLHLRIYNKKGKVIYGKSSTGVSQQKIDLITEGEYNTDMLTPVFEEAITDALAHFENELPRSIKKIRW